jgi:hypothetical protein
MPNPTCLNRKYSYLLVGFGLKTSHTLARSPENNNASIHILFCLIAMRIAVMQQVFPEPINSCLFRKVNGERIKVEDCYKTMCADSSDYESPGDVRIHQ